jgi:pSer/pThr/pTyr-binding forkhead associated (FHA) protein
MDLPLSPEPAPAPAPVAATTPKARLMLIKGEGFDGVSYQLGAQEHKLGRLHGTIVFPEDPYLSDTHANLYYVDRDLYLQDESSDNGVFIKIRKPMELQDGDMFLVGEQLIRLERLTSYKAIPHVNHDETDFYGCAAEERIYFRLVQYFHDGQEGTVFYSSSSSITIGREQCDLSFPFDKHISGQHARVYMDEGRCFLHDLGSKNGTFYRLRSPYLLNHGDYFFAGQQLLRVDLDY